MKVRYLPTINSSPIKSKDIFFSTQTGPLDLWATLQDHLWINQPWAQAHLFAYRTNGGYKPLKRSAFLKYLNDAATSLNLSHIKGHRICIGGPLNSSARHLLQSRQFFVVMEQWCFCTLPTEACCDPHTLCPKPPSAHIIYPVYNATRPLEFVSSAALLLLWGSILLHVMCQNHSSFLTSPIGLGTCF